MSDVLRWKRFTVAYACLCCRSEGWRGFFKGITPTLAQILPYMSFQFYFYEVATRAAKSASALRKVCVRSVSQACALSLSHVCKRLYSYRATIVKRWVLNMLCFILTGFARVRRKGAKAKFDRGCCLRCDSGCRQQVDSHAFRHNTEAVAGMRTLLCMAARGVSISVRFLKRDLFTICGACGAGARL